MFHVNEKTQSSIDTVTMLHSKLDKARNQSQGQWFTFIMLAFGRLRQEDPKLETKQGDLVSN